MVKSGKPGPVDRILLSVLALSSRFDGRFAAGIDINIPESFSTRSVESF